MCTTCGCGAEHEHAHADERQRRTIGLERDLLAENAALAMKTRRALDDLGVRMLNIIGGPGAGKTALLEATVPRLLRDVGVTVLEGDQATALDAQRIARTGCAVSQINTGPGCHLDAAMVGDALCELRPARGSIVFVENVGNLVCPALFDIGEHSKVVVMSVTEGEDKPLKYAHVFRAADLFLLTKIDLLPHVVFEVDRCIAHARDVNPRIRIIEVSAQAGVGIDDWCDEVKAELRR